MAHIKFDNGMDIQTDHPVTHTDGVTRIPQAMIEIRGQRYVAKDIVIEWSNAELSFPIDEDRRQVWSTELGGTRRTGRMRL